MIQLIEGAPEGVLAFEAVGEVDAAGLPGRAQAGHRGGAVRRRAGSASSSRSVPSSTGSRPAAAWDDMALEFRHLSDWERCALVTDLDWVQHAAKALGWLMGGRLRGVRHRRAQGRPRVGRL